MLYLGEIIGFLALDFVSIPLYIFVLYQLLFKPGFESSFFQLATIMGFVDLLNHLFIWFYFKLILFPGTAWIYLLIDDHSFGLTFMSFCIYFFTRARELLLLSSAFNRFTAICYPQQQQEIWKKWLNPLLAFCTAFPILIGFNTLFADANIFPFYEEEAHDGSYAIAVKAKWELLPWVNNAFISAVHTLLTSLASLTINIMSILTLFLRKSAKNNPTKAEINLLIVSCFDFGIGCLAVAHQTWAYSFTIRGIYYDETFDQLYLLYPWIYDIVNLSRPFILIIMCKQMRMAFLRVFGKRTLIVKPIISGTISFVKPLNLPAITP